MAAPAQSMVLPQPGQQPAGFHLFEAPHKRRLVFCLLLAVATLALYNPITRAPFCNYDDPVYVSDNAQVRAGLTWKTIAWSFRTPKALDWHPITWLSYALDSELFGLNPAGYHATNLFLHVFNVVLLFLILERATGLAWRSLAVAALFALHPINVESVAWIAERKNVLSMFFFLVALGAYGWYARQPGLRRYLVVTLAYVLALMSKAQAITFPFAVLLLDYWPLQRLESSNSSDEDCPPAIGSPTSFWRLLAEKLPWFALSLASAAITMKTGELAFSYLTSDATATFPLWVRLATAAIGTVKYVEKVLWPINLALVYPHPGFAISLPAAVLSALLVAAITTLVVIHHQQRPLFVGWFWFLITLAPMSGVVQIGPHAMADRYAYIPLLGIFVIFTWGAVEVIQRCNVPLPVTATCALAILLALGFGLHRQVGFWSDNVRLWTHTLQITEGNFTAEENLAMALIAQGKPLEALPHFQQAQLLRPGDPLAALNLATYQQMLGHYRAALQGYASVVQFAGASPSLLATAHTNGGYAHLSLKEYDNARQDFEAALRLQPANSAAYRGLGLVAQRTGDLAQAIANYRRSIELQPSPIAYLLLARALEKSGQTEAARAAESEAFGMTADLNDDVAVMRQLLAE
jgi:protein O-mannosyl-transferase